MGYHGHRIHPYWAIFPSHNTVLLKLTLLGQRIFYHNCLDFRTSIIYKPPVVGANNTMTNNTQERRELRTLQPEDIVGLKGISGSVISPDGKWAAFVRTVPVLEVEKSEHRGHIWLVSTDSGEPFQLTNGPNGDSSPQWSPDSTRLALSKSHFSRQSRIARLMRNGRKPRTTG